MKVKSFLRINLILLFIVMSVASIFCSDTDIKLNSVGYRPEARKVASITMACSDFSIVRSSDGSPVFSGTVTGPVTNSDTSQQIYSADFSSFTQPGIYNVYVPGVGYSFPFTIADNVYDDIYKTTMRGFYFWRCGTSVSGTYKGITFSHSACHMADGYLDKVGQAGVIRDATHGWHDAGDYNKYVVNAGVTLGVLFRAWMDYPEKIQSIGLEIPESGGMLPDFLAECKWELDWLMKMQAADGSIYHKLSGLDFSQDNEVPEGDNEKRYYVPYSTAATADFTAIMAMASRIYAPYDSGLAAQYLTAARASYVFLAANLSNTDPNDAGFSTGAYKTDDSDDRCWAAAELWETTGESVFKTDFESRASSFSPMVSSILNWSSMFDWGNVQTLGMLTYLFSNRTKDSTLAASIKTSLLASADDIVASAQAHGYARTLGSFYTWGSNGMVARQTLILMSANKAAPASKYINTAMDSMNFLLGRNYYGRSMVTGIGFNPPLHPHHRPSTYDSVAPPWPGYLVGGAVTSATDWTDSSADYTTNEVAINWNSAFVYGAAAFCHDVFTPTPIGTFTITPTWTVSPTITESFTITPTFSITPTFTITPTPVPKGVSIGENFPYPNPNKGKEIYFRYLVTDGFAKKIIISIYTFGERKIAVVQDFNKPEGYNTTKWRVNLELANGLYYYVIEADN
jgi:endoglucanase